MSGLRLEHADHVAEVSEGAADVDSSHFARVKAALGTRHSTGQICSLHLQHPVPSRPVSGAPLAWLGEMQWSVTLRGA